MADIVATKRAEKNAKRRKIVDKRRFKEPIVPTGSIAKKVAKDATRTMHLRQVQDPTGERPILKDGKHNSKIGGTVMLGRLEGAPIRTLSLEERATCPRSCEHWRSCYGNNDQHATRWRHGDELMDRLEDEIDLLILENKQALIRLHYLGDFWSSAYVAWWADMITKHQGLHAFGFTAWKPGTEIGDMIARVRALYPQRFMIRHSGTCGKWGSFTIDLPTQKKTIGDAVTCPEQLDSMNGGDQSRHCANCAVCWSTAAAIVFVEH